MPDESGESTSVPGFVQTNLQLPQKLETRGSLANNWKTFKRLWINYEIASQLDKQRMELRTATLISCIGPEALEIYDGLPFANEEDKTNINRIMELMEAHCVGETNEIYERYLFNRRNQENGESVESFIAALRSLAKTCNYGELQDGMIRDRIVVGIADNSIRKKLLTEAKLTLAKCVDICRANEATAKRLKEMSQQSGEISAITTGPPRRKTGSKGGRRQESRKPPHTDSSKSNPHPKCKFCHRLHPRAKEKCPAWQKTCDTCGELNHFSVACKALKASKKGKKPIHNLDYESYSDYGALFTVESVGTLNTNPLSPKKIYAHMRLRDELIKFQLDCGATVNILPEDLYKKVFNDPKLKRLQKSSATLVMFNKSELKPLGVVNIETLNPRNNDLLLTKFAIVPRGYTPLLGAQSVQNFKLMTVNSENIMSLSDSSPTLDPVSEFPDVFKGEGKLDQKLHLELDATVPPVILPVRKVPLAVREPLKNEIDRLVGLGVLQSVDVPTEWVSSMVVVKKPNGKIRLCIDPKPLNKALKRNRYPLPVIDDLLPQLTNAKVFSVVDAKNGFWHIQLDDKSSFLTTFGTPWGRYRWTRMPFGIAPAPEEFQRRLVQALEGLEGVKPIFDDILIFGKGDSKEEAIRDHDAKLRSLLERCRQKGIKLNKEKLKLRCAEVKFMGHVVSTDGLKPDPDKLQGIEEMPTPTNKQDIKRLLGMANYLQKFAPNLSEAAAPMREVLREENQFHWDEQVQGQSFKNVKKIVSQAPVLKFFDPHEEVELQCDASEKGMGACLMQKGQPVAYASRSLTETEKNYAQIEKEMLSIVFGVERFEHYLYGRPIKVETDHKPLESIFKKSLISAPKRLQRMMLRLQKFDLQVNYKRGAEMYLADTLSRAFRGQKRSASRDDVGDVMLLGEMRGTTEREVESIDMIQFLPVSEATQASLRQATEQDTAMRELKSIIRQGWPEVKDDVPVSIRDYYSFRDELSLQNGLVFKGERLVIPNSSRVEMLAKIHASHIGIQGCLRRAREVLYWPGMNKEVEEYVAKCEICNSHLSEQGKEPIICHEIPNRPWEKVGIDLFELNGKDFVLTVDYYSGFFEVDRLEGKTAKEVMRKIKPHVARHGIPDQIMSDNGPPFDSHEFRQFTNSYGIEHVTSSPGYAQSNGKVENAIKTAKNLMKKATESNKDPYLALLDWRNTPSETVGYSPVQRLFNRRTKTLLPTSSRLLKPSVPRDVRQKLTLQKARQSLNYNCGAKELEELKQGDVVRLQPTKTVGRAKQWKQARVEGKVDIRSYQVRTEDGRVYRRNRRHLRKTREQMQPPQQEDIEMHFHFPSRPAKPVMPTTHKQQQQEKQPSEKAPENAAQDVPDVPAEQRTRSGRVVKPPVRFQ
ncbi:uncharacterized protein K02A2.6-like [Nematostella vectensis]|uniref:uncharacterized protein K02A2.6-like n=1 Tax=Nematostella vectensis TaxID=45351 RepID=UPI0020772E6E|nr:uncharacterized protein K02A2.6-like [Nematostella vectensis]